jgi:hypothetical protein
MVVPGNEDLVVLLGSLLFWLATFFFRGVKGMPLFVVNSLKTGDFEKHYMLSSLRLMRSICCDNVPVDMRAATRYPPRRSSLAKGCRRKALRTGG